jgi:alpha-glucosidase
MRTPGMNRSTSACSQLGGAGVRVFAALALWLLGASIAWAEPVSGRGELVDGASKPVARFVASYFRDDDRVATFAFVKPPTRTADLPVDWRTEPLFERLDDGRHRVVVPVSPGTSLYGTGEVSGPLLRNGWRVTLWNSDFPGYTIRNPSLYQSHPWVFAVRADGSAFGVLVDTTWRTTITLDGAIEFVSEGRPAPVYIIERSSPQELCTALMELTGPMPLPPKWALGYQQSRWSYYPEARVRQIASEFRRRQLAASVLWFDIDYMDGFRTFTFDPKRFPDPKRLNEELGAQGWKRVWMINPGIKDEQGYFVRDQLVERGFQVMVPGADGKPQTFRGDVWPGPCVFPDFTRDDTRQWWGTLYKDFMAKGVDGVWNDMNEPAIFSTPNRTMPDNAIHAGGQYRAAPDAPAQVVTPGDHLRFHNVYGMLMAQATFDGILAANPEKRPFVLTRASFLGGHRYAATWTGDNSTNWADLEASIPMINNLGLSGQPFVGPDIGGFIGAGPSDLVERGVQYARWMGIGALFPFSRGHTARDNINKEPWEFGPEVERSVRFALERRARLMPYLYTLFREASVTGLPVMRPVFFADPTDAALRSEDDAFLLGADLLVVPQLVPDGSRTVLLPRNHAWRKFEVAAESTPNNPDLYIRAGAIIPTGPAWQWVGQPGTDQLRLIVCPDENGNARGQLYEDAGDGFAYRNGEYLLTTFEAKREGNTLIVNVASAEGTFPRPTRATIVRVITERGLVEARGREGTPIKVTLPR